jgi:uncharacterized protein (TIGR02246 family)
MMRMMIASVVMIGSLFAQTTKTSKDEAAIRAADTQWSQALSSKDLDKALSFYADDASAFPYNAPIVSGKNNIRDMWSHLFQSPGFQLQFAPTKIQVAKAGDMAYDEGTFQGKMNGSDGNPMDVQGKYVVVWKKQGGQWKAVADIFNTDK